MRGEIRYGPHPALFPDERGTPARYVLIQSPQMEPGFFPPGPRGWGQFFGMAAAMPTPRPGEGSLTRQQRHALEPSGAYAAEPIRTLSPEGGWRRVVCWGEFKQLLLPQIAHAERLRDSHRLPCMVVVHEVLAPQARSELERMLQREEGQPVRLEPLTRQLVMRLGLAAVLPPGRRVARPPGREGEVIPFQRFLELHVVDDPTRADQAPRALPRPSPSEPAAPTPRRTNIPAAWLRPWEFRLSREEALYDMEAGRSWWSQLRAAISRIITPVSTRAALEKWRTLLTGKPVDQQLWGVRPPRVALSHPRTRGWLARALAAAGYDPTTMLEEWEVFWRRKGV